MQQSLPRKRKHLIGLYAAGRETHRAWNRASTGPPPGPVSVDSCFKPLVRTVMYNTSVAQLDSTDIGFADCASHCSARCWHVHVLSGSNIGGTGQQVGCTESNRLHTAGSLDRDELAVALNIKMLSTAGQPLVQPLPQPDMHACCSISLQSHACQLGQCHKYPKMWGPGANSLHGRMCTRFVRCSASKRKR